MRRRVWVFGWLLMLSVVAGCGGESHGHGSAHPTSTTTTVVDPIPAVITVPYVDSVLAQLNIVYSEALRTSLTTKTVNSQVKTELRAIYADPLYATELRVFRDQLAHIPSDLKSPLGVRVTTVKSIISADKDCIFISTHTDFSQLISGGSSTFASEYYSLVPRISNDDPDHLNPTLWMFGFNSASLRPTSVPNPCKSSS